MVTQRRFTGSARASGALPGLNAATGPDRTRRLTPSTRSGRVSFLTLMRDFHAHSFLSDGVLSPIELIRRAHVAGYAAIAVTDHAGPGNVEVVLEQLRRDCEVANQHWGIVALPGVEITHVPPAAISELARRARRNGASVVIVHGESVVEPVEPGTNLAAIMCDEVDLLAHPGLLSLEDAKRAAARGCFVEISGRRGHAFANGHIVQVARRANVRLVVNSDAHAPEDLLSERFARTVLLGAGFPESEIGTVLDVNAQDLLTRVSRR